MAASGTVLVELKEGMRFDAVGEDGVVVQLDSDAVHGGVGSGFRPMELLLAGLGACTAMDVISILRKKRQNVTAYRIEVSGTQAEEYPRVFTDITIRHILQGNELSSDGVQRSIALSEEKYCPAFAMLSKATSITSTFEIQPIPPRD